MTTTQALAAIAVCAAIIAICTRLANRQAAQPAPPTVTWECPHCAQQVNLDVTRASVSYIDTTEAHHHMLQHQEAP